MSSTNLTRVVKQIQNATTPTAALPHLQVLIDHSRCEILDKSTPSGISTLILLLDHPNPAIAEMIVEALEQLSPDSGELLLAKFNDCSDHGTQARIVKILANVGGNFNPETLCNQVLELLIEMVGAEIANHCQGNVRRIAARGLGRILRSHPSLANHKQAIDKLIWALQHTEDWALRYAAAVSLGEIATDETIMALKQALVQEVDHVVQRRIQFLLSA